MNDIYDQELIPLKSSAKEFEQDKDLIVQIHQSQIQTQSASLVNHLQTLQVLQDQLKEAQRKYEEAKDAANSARNGVSTSLGVPNGSTFHRTTSQTLSTDTASPASYRISSCGSSAGRQASPCS